MSDPWQRAIDDLVAEVDSDLEERMAAIEATLAQVKREGLILLLDLAEQWRHNHSARCWAVWPHDGECRWPPPVSMGGESVPAVEALLAVVDGRRQYPREGR